MLDIDEVRKARIRVASVLRATPVERVDSLDRLAGQSILLKPEQRQRTGSFKIRGAYNAIAQLEPGVEVVAGSAGNHAQGVALAAQLTGRRSTVFMPVDAALPKVEATRGYGAEIRLVGDNADEAIDAARAYAEECGAVFIPPFDHAQVIAGQGTIGLELIDQAPSAGAILVPVGGGGLISGIGVSLSAIPASDRPRLIGVQVADRAETIADGIAVRAPSQLTQEHITALVDEIVTVAEEEISAAVVALLERAKSVVEPAGAVGLAAVLAGKVTAPDPVVVLLSGGNVDPLVLMRLIEHGLTAGGRYALLRVVLEDRPGTLAALTGALADLRINVLSVEHHRTGMALALNAVEVVFTVETRDHAHRDEMVEALRATGFDASIG